MNNCPFKWLSRTVSWLKSIRTTRLWKNKGVWNFWLIDLTPEAVSDIFDKLNPTELDPNVMSGNTLHYFACFQEFRDISLVWIEIFLRILFYAGIIPEIHMQHIENNRDQDKSRLFNYWISAIYWPDRFLSQLIELSGTLEEFDIGLNYVKSILYKLAQEPQWLEQIIEQSVSSLLSVWITPCFRLSFDSILQQLDETWIWFYECPALRNGIIKKYLNAVIPIYRQCMIYKIQHNNNTPSWILKRKFYKLMCWK